MNWYHRKSFKFKITFLSTIAASAAIIIVSACFIFFEMGTFKSNLQNEQLVRLNIYSGNISAAIVFDDQKSVDDTFSDFRKIPGMEQIAVFTPTGALRSRYTRSTDTPETRDMLTEPIGPVGSRGYVYKNNRLYSQVPVTFEGEVIAVIVSETRLTALRQKIANYFIIALAVVPIAIALAYLLGRVFSVRLARPIEDLAETMARVKKTNDYELTAQVIHENEMGRLAANFNEMLMEIRLRDQRLETQTRELVNEKEKAEAASKAKSEFLANMSHELRTPMNGILGMTEVLIRSGLEDKQKQFADIIYRSGSALTTILNDILDFSKIEADKLDLDFAPFEIKTMVTDVIDLLDNKAVSKDIQLVVNFNPYLEKMALGDAGRIRQVLTNIVGNAIKFTHDGQVTLDIRGKTAGDKYKLSMSVTDTGIGIPSDKLDLIFQKFTQAESSTTRDYGGTGLGLAISKSLVEMMGGQMGARSELGKGSTFWFDILVDPYEQPESESDRPPTLDKVKLLFVSHSNANRNVIANQLTSLGASTTSHNSGTQALQQLNHLAMAEGGLFPIFIIEDHKKGIDALSLIDRLRATELSEQAAIIVLRSDTTESKTTRYETYAKLMALNAPVSIKALLKAINTTLDNANCPPLFNLETSADTDMKPPSQDAIKPQIPKEQYTPASNVRVSSTPVPPTSIPKPQNLPAIGDGRILQPMESYPPELAAPAPETSSNPYAETVASEPESIWSKKIRQPTINTETQDYAPIQAVKLNATSEIAPSQNLQDNPYRSAAEPPSEHSVAVQINPVPHSNKLRILVAEDNHINQMVMENMLGTDVYDVHFEMDGKSAVEAHLKHPYDIILMDISMPEMNGLEATEAIRDHEKATGSAQVPIIAVTAHAMKSHQETYREAGMNDFLPKPISKQELDAVLIQWVSATPSQQRLTA